MKVLFVIDSLRQGGAERSTVQMACHFRQQGWEVEVAIFNPDDQVFRRELDAAQVPVHALSWGSVFSDAMKLKKLCDRMQPNVVMFCLYNTALRVRMLRLIRPRTRILESLVSFSHSAPLARKGYMGYMKQLVRKNIDKISSKLLGQQYHAVSDSVRDYYANNFGMDGQQIHVVHRGRDVPDCIGQEERSRVRKDVFDVSDDQYLIVTVGRQEAPKNLACLVDCAALLAQRKYPHDFVFALVGREGEATQSIQDAVARTGTTRQFRHIGFRSDVIRIIQAADAFVLPSYNEGIAGAVIEAMSVGLPVLASDVPSLREVSGGSCDFRFFDPDRPEQLADAIVALREGWSGGRSISQNNIALFHARYSSKNIMRSMQSLVEHVVESEK